MAETSLTEPKVIMGSTLYRRSAFVLDKFLANQQEIQQAYPNSSLILATEEPDFVAELQEQIDRYNLKGEAIVFEVVKPDYARSHIWSVTCGREAIRQHALSQGAEYLLSMDCDMTYDPEVISIMRAKIQGFGAVFSAYRLRPGGWWGFANGCLMLDRETMSKISFICYEFKNGEELDDSEAIVLELFRCQAKVNRGIFVSFRHYQSRQEYFAGEPQPIGWFRVFTSNLLVRYILARIMLLVKFNIARRLLARLYKEAKPETRGE